MRRQKEVSEKRALSRKVYFVPSLVFLFYFFRGSSSVFANASRSFDKEFPFAPAYVDFSDSGLLRESSVYTVCGNSYFSARRYRRVSNSRVEAIVYAAYVEKRIRHIVWHAARGTSRQPISLKAQATVRGPPAYDLRLLFQFRLFAFIYCVIQRTSVFSRSE